LSNKKCPGIQLLKNNYGFHAIDTVKNFDSVRYVETVVSRADSKF